MATPCTRPAPPLPLRGVLVQEAPKTAAQQLAARKDKQGNPFEFIQLLMSLTKRW